MRDEAVEEGYITRAKGDDRPRTDKEAQVGQVRLAEISCADLVWKIRPSLAQVWPIARLSLRTPHQFIFSLPFTDYRQDILHIDFDHFQTHLMFPNSVSPLIGPLP
jgi:hypothetical protein